MCYGRKNHLKNNLAPPPPHKNVLTKNFFKLGETAQIYKYTSRYNLNKNEKKMTPPPHHVIFLMAVAAIFFLDSSQKPSR